MSVFARHNKVHSGSQVVDSLHDYVSKELVAGIWNAAIFCRLITETL